MFARESQIKLRNKTFMNALSKDSQLPQALIERFEQLEEKLAYLEMANSEMSDEIFRQQREIDTLTRAHQNLRERVETLNEGIDDADGALNEKPPHY